METKLTEALPFVSVIIPVYNDPKRIGITIEALLNQTYPSEKYEIIIVDNGSDDNTKETVKKYPVRLFEETLTRSSYAARNKGIEQAKGKILAFTDSDCKPRENWIEKGVEALKEADASLAGGKACFQFTDKKGAAQFYDACNHIQTEESIQKRKVAYTANLFVKAEVFEDVGKFPGNFSSGGDVYFTFRASSAGYRIVYAPNAIIEHPTRTWHALLKKAFRVGKGKGSTIKSAKGQETMNSAVIGHGAALSRINPIRLKKKIANLGYDVGFTMFIRILIIACLLILMSALGAVYGILFEQKK